MAVTDSLKTRADDAPYHPDAPHHLSTPPAKAPRPPAPEFPGCKPVHLPREALDRYEGRLEFWDSATEIAWVCEPTSPYHERPSRLLTRLAERIASVRGSPIECYGSMDLLLRDEHGEPRRILQADESVYLHPAQARLPGAAAMVIGEHDFPDVVLEVDHTTDVYRGKLWLYESWGFPEVWVDVPDAPSPSRARRRLPGLTIHLLDSGAYRVSAESRTFPGWRAQEIHIALNEKTLSAQTCAVLERVGEALGTREGTGPDDDPLLRPLRSRSRAEGLAEGERKGRAEGLAEGERKGRAEGLAEGERKGRAEGERKGRADALAKMARRMLRSRGIEVSEGFVANAAFAASSEDAVFEAALASADETDFFAALRHRDGADD